MEVPVTRFTKTAPVQKKKGKDVTSSPQPGNKRRIPTAGTQNKLPRKKLKSKESSSELEPDSDDGK
jgi:hypothetical protein